MVVAADAEKKIGVTQGYLIEILGDVVVKECHTRRHVHGHHCAGDGIRHRVYVCAQKGKVRNVCGIIVFVGVGIKADKVEKGGVKREIVVAIQVMERALAAAQTVMIANDTDIRHFQFAQHAPHPFIFLGKAKIRLVSSMHHEVYPRARVDVAHEVFCIIIETLCVADLRESYGVEAATLLLYKANILAGEVDRAIYIYVVRMIFY